MPSKTQNIPPPPPQSQKSDQHLALQKPNPGYPQTSMLYAYRHTTACSAQTLRASKRRPARLRAEFASPQRTTPASLMTAAE
jgi:pyrroline-5-carboxylate reductase